MQIRPEIRAGLSADRKSSGILRRSATVLAMLLAVITVEVLAQGVQLTPEQQNMLNQLPRAQREAALQQLGNLQESQATASAATPVQAATIISVPQALTDDPERPPVFSPGDTLVLGLQLQQRETARAEAIDADDKLLSRLLAGNPYKLDALGRLVLPGIGELKLAGLTAGQATLRLNSDPALANFNARVTRLPLSAVGVDALRPFGYELFRPDAGLSLPNVAVPVVADYVLGVGDTVRVQLFGNLNAEYEMPVDRNGAIQFPEIGPLSVAGLNYVRVQEMIGQRVSEQFIGTQVSVTLGELRALQIFVLGDVRTPGSYSVSPMSTITTALAQSGGVASQGSLRRVQLKRNGRLVQTLDVYDLLLNGDTRADIRLRAGDVVFVPPVGTRVTVAGEVNRPAIYEYVDAADVQDVIELAGGPKSTAYLQGVKIERLEPGRGLRVIEADQTGGAGQRLKIVDGDTVVVPIGVAQLEDSITLAGNAQRPGVYEWREGIRISDLIPDSRAVKESSDLNYLLIRREVVPNAELAVLSADLEAAWRDRGGDEDVVLRPRDTVYVFSLAVGREHIVEPLIAELQLRSSYSHPLAVVRVGGKVNAGGQYPIEAGMRVSDLVRAAGGPAESAYLREAELTRYEIVDGEARNTTLINIDLGRALAGESADDITLQPFDYLNVKEVPHWRDQAFVEISGEVVFAGRYTIAQGETLVSVLERAGGLTDLAYPGGSIFTRDSLRQQEREQLDVLANRIESDLAAISINDPTQSEAVSTGQSLLSQLRNARPVGRLVIDLDDLISGVDEDVVLRDGDTLRIPTAPQGVTVIGEVQYATSHLYDPDFSRDDYIDSSGGATRKADKKQIYVVRVSGEVVVQQRSRFFARSGGAEIEPGDTIVVPLHTDRLRKITLWTNVTQIIYQMAIAAAAVNSF